MATYLKPQVTMMYVIREVSDINEAGTLEDAMWRPVHVTGAADHDVSVADIHASVSTKNQKTNMVCYLCPFY